MHYQLHRPLIKKPRRRPAKVWLIGSIVLIILVAWLITRYFAAPAKGHNVNVDQKVASTNTLTTSSLPANLPASTLTSSYFSLKLPIGYQVQPSNSSVTPGLLYYKTIIKPSDSGSLIINISLQALGAGGLGDNSLYSLRTSQPAVYSISQQTQGGEPVKIVTRKDGLNGELVAFWPHGGVVAIISLTLGVTVANGSSDSGQSSSLNTILGAWQWH